MAIEPNDPRDRVFARIPKRQGEEIWVLRRWYEGREYISIEERWHPPDEPADVWLPRRGRRITFPAHKPEIAVRLAYGIVRAAGAREQAKLLEPYVRAINDAPKQRRAQARSAAIQETTNRRVQKAIRVALAAAEANPRDN